MKSSTKKHCDKLSDLKPRILGNSEIMGKIQKLVDGRAYYTVSLPEKKLVLVVKNHTKTYIKVSCPIKFCLISFLILFH